MKRLIITEEEKLRIFGLYNELNEDLLPSVLEKPVPFKNVSEGNKFREWVNLNYPKIAKEIDLDKNSPYYNNSYITKAWNFRIGYNTLGDLYERSNYFDKTFNEYLGGAYNFNFMNPKQNNYDAIFVAGLTSVVSMGEQLKSFKSGFGKDTKVATFHYTGEPYGHNQTIAQVLADNPKIPVFLFSAGALQVSNIASDRNTDVNKIFVIEPYFGKGQTVQSKIKAAIGNGVPTNHIYVGAYPDVGLGVVADATPTSSLNSQSHVDSVTVVARKHSMV